MKSPGVGRAQDGNIVNNLDRGSPGENKDEKNIKKNLIVVRLTYSKPRFVLSLFKKEKLEPDDLDE